MTGPEVIVQIIGTEFSTGDLQQFLDRIEAVYEMPPNARIEVSHDIAQQPTEYTLRASSAFRRPE